MTRDDALVHLTGSAIEGLLSGKIKATGDDLAGLTEEQKLVKTAVKIAVIAFEEINRIKYS